MFHGLLFNVNVKIYSGRNAGVHRIATHLRENNWDIEVVDFACFWTLENLKLFCRTRISDNTKFIGFSHPFGNWSNNLEFLSSWLKENYPDILILSGSSSFPLFDTPNIDYYITGYGEKALDHLLKWKFNNGNPPIIKTTKDNKKIIDAVHSYPSYPHKAPTIYYEKRDFINENEFLLIEFSRGCRFSNRPQDI